MSNIRRNDYVIYNQKVCMVRDIYEDGYMLLSCVENGQTYLAYPGDVTLY